MRIERLSPDQWKLLSENAHLVVFGEKNPPEHDRLDYALLCTDGPNVLGYITVREIDHETVHWQFGGAFPGTKGTLHSLHAYMMAVRWTKERYKNVTTFIENKNVTMLKFAMKAGFLIRGVRHHGGAVLLDLLLEFK